MCVYNHNICIEIRSKINPNRKNIGVGFLVCREENGALVIMLGREVAGPYAKLYNMCAGGQENVDRKCFLETLKREARQEFKLIFNNWNEMNNILKGPDSKIRYFMLNGTPIFVGVYPRNHFSFLQLQAQVRSCVYQYNLPWSDREMDDLMMLKTNPQISFTQQVNEYANGQRIRFDGENLKISHFARSCAIHGLNLLQQEGLFINHAR